MSEVLDLHPDAAGNGSLNEAGATSSSGQFTADALQRGEVVRHVVPGCPGAVYTFAQHAGLVFLPAALPAQQQAALVAAALEDYCQPPARTNHTRLYGPLPGLWRAATERLRLNWTRRVEEPAAPQTGAAPTRRVACERRPPKPHRLPDSTTSGAAAAAPTAPLQEAVGAAHHAAAGTAQSQACAERCRSHAAAQAPGCSAPEPAAQAQSQPHTEPASCSGRPGADCNGYQGATGGEDGAAAGEADRTCRGRSRSRSRSRSIRSSSSCSSGSCASGALLADFAAAAAAGSRGGADEGEEEDGGGGCAGPSYEQCWSRDGPGPAAEQLLRKLRWATLGPQFDWTERQYDFTGAYRQLPPSLSDLARQMAAVVDALQAAGMQLMPAAAEAEVPQQPAAPRVQATEPSQAAAGAVSAGLAPPTGAAPAAPRGYEPDAAIVNYYQIGDVLGGHVDDVESDLAQPIVSVSLGCPALFLMGGRTKATHPSALLLRGGDVLVLAGQARSCYHGVPRILEAGAELGAAVAPARAKRVAAAGWSGLAPSTHEDFTRTARINISIRAVR
ncbi:hypothetical protein CHLRE_06g278198v5 [Chlamydomonas reinhardtii]|uniref:Fe2OG dioxygenase domain-containing protein n=1 Tax=Chlamydomonas reinhardtii TaxID=3055 RepID=A0A2K3DP50_CHLRE|nr:uncharacterized protein CHLRE_06g278198v5 [Chlamydomonas reinhardtii]PNW82309.1 hypothetical protein CHLRE_06g278198v5 [Chlamydomonas reinhardtii]